MMRSMISWMALLLGLAPVQAAGVPAPARIRETLDVRYYPGRDRHLLDVFSPKAKPGARHPVVLFVHGGTWMAGDKNWFGVYRGVGQSLARQGIVAVLINYRLSPKVRHPAHVKDVARAYAWTVRNIDRYGGDPEQIILAGHSSGGHLASLLATDDTYLKDPALKLTKAQRKAIRGVVCISGVYRIPEPAEFRRMADRVVDNMMGRVGAPKVGLYLGPTLKMASVALNPFHLVFGLDEEVRTKASPISHVKRGLPPFLLFNSEYEVPGLWPMALDFEKELRKNGVEVMHKEVEGCTHRTIVKRLHNDDDPMTIDLVKFIKRCTAKVQGDRT